LILHIVSISLVSSQVSSQHAFPAIETHKENPPFSYALWQIIGNFYRVSGGDELEPVHGRVKRICYFADGRRATIIDYSKDGSPTEVQNFTLESDVIPTTKKPFDYWRLSSKMTIEQGVNRDELVVRQFKTPDKGAVFPLVLSGKWVISKNSPIRAD
jgi:hypothetical protein